MTRTKMNCTTWAALFVVICVSRIALGDDNLGAASQAARQNTSVNFKNSTSEPLSVCIAYRDEELNSWVTEGFWKLKPMGKLQVSVPAAPGSLHYRASGDHNWGAAREFWVSDGPAFIIKAADSEFPSFAKEKSRLNYDKTIGMRRVKFDKAKAPANSDEVSINLVASNSKDHYAAVAFSLTTKKYGWASGYHSREEAEKAAKSNCNASDARIAGWAKNRWLVFARGRGNSYGCSDGETRAEATSKALAECAKRARGGHVEFTLRSDLDERQ